MLIQNAVMVTSTGQIYKSWHRHDYVSFEVGDKTYFIDGGLEYFRTNVEPHNSDVQWLCLSDDDGVELLIDKYVSKNEQEENALIKSLTIAELQRVLERAKYPLLQEAISILISRKSSLLDMIVEPHS
jgi:hypothetical protein